MARTFADRTAGAGRLIGASHVEESEEDGATTIGDRLTRVNRNVALIATALGSLTPTENNVSGVAVSGYDVFDAAKAAAADALRDVFLVRELAGWPTHQIGSV